MSQVKSGFRRAAAWLLGMAWLGLVFGGMAVAFTPSPQPRAIGWAMLALATVILVVTMDRWVEVFSALLACGILGGIITIAQGHAVNSPQVRVARLDAVIMTLLIAASAVASFTFTKRKLRLPDRVSLFVFVFCFFWGAAVPRLGLLALSIGTASLVAAWGYYQIERRHRSKVPTTSSEKSALAE